jgi:hypothetical protein
VTLPGLCLSLSGCEVLVGIHDKTVGDADVSGADAGDGALDPSASCALQPQQANVVFCDDFDESAHVYDQWTWNSVTPAQTESLGFDTRDYTSSPNSAQITAASSTMVATAQLGKNFDLGSASRFHVAFDLRIDVPALTAIPQTGILQVIVGTSLQYNLELGPGATGALVVYDTSSALVDSVSIPVLPAMRTWTRIVLAYDAGAMTVALSSDATPLATTSAIRPGAAGMSTLLLGAAFVNPGGTAPLTIEVDNVVVRVIP